MKKILFLICILTVFTLYAEKPLWQCLENLSQHDKENSSIDIDCKKEAISQAKLVEEAWNNGNYDEAIEIIKNSSLLQDAGVGVQWKNPTRTSARWGNDVRIGNRDSIMCLAFDVDNATGNLFTAFIHNYDTNNYRWSVCFSSDTGKTWAETFAYLTHIIEYHDIDGVVLGNHFYVALLGKPLFEFRKGFLRRFNLNDGSHDTTYGSHTIFDEGINIREIALAGDADGDNNFINYYALMDNDSIIMRFSDASGTSWMNSPKINVGNAYAGLDACCAIIGSSTKSWASYIGGILHRDSLFAIELDGISWSHHGPLGPTDGISDYRRTSIDAYGDTVIIVFGEYSQPPPRGYARYYITYNGDSPWFDGVLSDDNVSPVSATDVTARGGDGIAVVYFTNSLYEGYRHRDYSGLWSPIVAFADAFPYSPPNPNIERIADGIYGIVFSGGFLNLYEAYFDRSDWIESGIEETEIPDENIASFIGPKSAIFFSQTDIDFYIPAGNTDNSLEIYDITGSHVITLAKGIPAGINSATWFGINKEGKKVPNGTYFCVLKSGEAKTTKKLIAIIE